MFKYRFTYFPKESMVTIECIIPQRHHRTVMGARGCKVQGITAEFDVQIKFPDRVVQGKYLLSSFTVDHCFYNSILCSQRNNDPRNK